MCFHFCEYKERSISAYSHAPVRRTVKKLVVDGPCNVIKVRDTFFLPLSLYTPINICPYLNNHHLMTTGDNKLLLFFRPDA